MWGRVAAQLRAPASRHFMRQTQSGALWRRLDPPFASAELGRGQRRSVTTVFNVKPPDGTDGEQTLFVVGLNESKFFGQDGSEEALKLLEQVVQHQGPNYTLLLGITDREYTELEADWPTKQGKLTPSRQLEGSRNAEFVPVIQAGMIDQCKRRPCNRPLKTTQNHLAWMLFWNPMEAIKVYWAYFQRKAHRNAAARTFWMKHFPICAPVYFEEFSELMAVRAVESMMGSYNQGKTMTWVLVVNNAFFQPTTEKIAEMIDENAAEKFKSAEFVEKLRNRALDLTIDVPDLTPLLFIYIGVPAILLQWLYLQLEHAYYNWGVVDKLFIQEDRD